MSMQLFIFSTLARLFPRTAHVQAVCALWLRFIMVVTQKVDHLYPAPHSFKLMSVQLFIFSTLARLFPRTAHAQAVCALWLRFITVVTQIVSHLYLVTVEWTSLVAARLREFEWNVMGIHCLLPFLRKLVLKCLRASVKNDFLGGNWRDSDRIESGLGKSLHKWQQLHSQLMAVWTMSIISNSEVTFLDASYKLNVS